LAEELGLLGHDVYVLAPHGSHGGHFKVITPVAPAFNNPEGPAYEAIKPSLRDFDIIHDHSWAAHVYLAKREWPKLNVLHTIHSPNPYDSNPVEKPCWVTPSYWLKEHTQKRLGTLCEVIYHGIDLGRHKPHLEAKEDFLLYLARVTPFKGALEFVELCKATGWRGKLAGEDWYVEDQGFVRSIMDACAATNGQVEYLGRAGQEWKVELLQQAACLVTPLMPPYYEIFGLSTIEAMACGTPVLSTDRGAAKELIIHGQTGAIAINETCLETNLELALSCKPEDCIKRAEEFSARKMARNHVSLYNKVLNGASW